SSFVHLVLSRKNLSSGKLSGSELSPERPPSLCTQILWAFFLDGFLLPALLSLDSWLLSSLPPPPPKRFPMLPLASGTSWTGTLVVRGTVTRGKGSELVGALERIKSEWCNLQTTAPSTRSSKRSGDKCATSED